jgi:hypothetical protein
MSCLLCYVTYMSRGTSGRIVIEVEPEFKKHVYSALALSGSTMKDWFLKHASDFLANREQESRRGVSYLSMTSEGQPLRAAEEPVSYKLRPKAKSKRKPKT